MNGFITVISSIFWGVILLSVAVFIHEAGHFLAARACGLRVKEFFLGLPCRFRISHTNKKYGTKVGVTAFLLGGYNSICGMEEFDIPQNIADIFAFVMQQGRVSVSEVAQAFDLDNKQALQALAYLEDLAAIEPYYDEEAGEKPDGKYYPEHFQTTKRDAQLLTVFDKGHDFSSSEQCHLAGQPAALPQDISAEQFLCNEKKKTYAGIGFWKRAFVLVAGAAVNIVCGFILMIGLLSVVGIQTAVNTNTVGGVEQNSLAQQAGISQGDTIVKIGTTDITNWQDIQTSLKENLVAAHSFDVVFEHDGALQTKHVEVPKDATSQLFGISPQIQTVHPNVIQSAQLSCAYIAMVGQNVVQLLVPSHAQAVIEQSTSVVGISVMASQAASAGASALLELFVALTMSLGFMNLLPIPPLDGGKLLIEIIQALIHRELPAKVKATLNTLGILLFVVLFVVLLRQDILRFVLPH